MERMQRSQKTKAVHQQDVPEYLSPYFVQHRTTVPKEHEGNQSQTQFQQSVEKMQEQQFTVQTELTNLNHKLRESETTCESLSSQNQLRQSIRKLHEWQSAALTEVANLTRKLKESQAAYECEHQNLLEVQMTLEQVSLHHKTELKAQEVLRSKIEHSRTVCNTLQKHCEDLAASMQRCISVQDKMTEQVNKQSAQIFKFESHYISLKEHYSHKVESLENLLRKERAQSKREKQKNMEDHTRLGKCYELLQEGLQEQLSQEQQRHTELDEKLGAAKSKVHQMKMTQISNTQEFSMKMEIAKEELHQLSCQKEELDILLRDAQQENVHLKSVAEEKERLEFELEQKINSIAQLDESVKKHAKCEEELNLCIEAIRQEMEQLKIETDNTVIQLRSKESDLQQKFCLMKIKHEKEVSELMRTLNEAQNQAATIEASLKLQLETCQVEYETLKVQCQKIECGLRDELQVALDFITQLKLKSSDDSEKYQNTKFHFDNQRKCLEDQIRIHQEAEQQMAQEVAQVREELKKSYEHQRTAEEAAAQRQQSLEARILEEKHTVETLQSNVNTLVKEQALANATIEEKETEIVHICQQLEKLKEMFEKVSQKADRLDEECIDLKEKLEALNKCIQTSEDETRAFKQKCELLECTLQSEKSELLELKNVINSKDGKIISLEKVINETKETCQKFENENSELNLHIETSRKTSDKDIQLLKEKFQTEISAKEEKISLLETRSKGLKHQHSEIQKNLEKLELEFQNNLQLEKNKTQEQLQIAEKKYAKKLLKKDKVLEEVRNKLKCSDQQVNHSKEQVANLEKHLTETLRKRDTEIMEKEVQLKQLRCDVDISKKTSEDYYTQLSDAQDNVHQTQANLNELQKRYEYTSVILQKVKSKLTKAQIKQKHAEREALTSKNITKRIENEFSTYKMERKRMRMQAVFKRSKSLPIRRTPYPSMASCSSSSSECHRTPTNTIIPSPPRSILKSSKASTPECSRTVKGVKFSEAGSSSSSIAQESEETGAMYAECVRTRVKAPYKKKKRSQKVHLDPEKVVLHQDYKNSTQASSKPTEMDGVFKRPFPKEWSDSSEPSDNLIRIMLG